LGLSVPDVAADERAAAMIGAGSISARLTI